MFVLVLWPKTSWFKLCPNFQSDLFVFDFLSLLLTSDLLFQSLCLLVFGVVGSAKQCNFSKKITSGARPSYFCNSQASNPFPFTETDVTLRIRLFSSWLFYHVSKWLHRVEQCKNSLALSPLIQWFSLVVQSWHAPVLPPKKRKIKIGSSSCIAPRLVELNPKSWRNDIRYMSRSQI